MAKKKNAAVLLYRVLKPIFYTNPGHPLAGTMVLPADAPPDGLPFPHLPASGIELLLRRGVLSSQETKEHDGN